MDSRSTKIQDRLFFGSSLTGCRQLVYDRYPVAGARNVSGIPKLLGINVVDFPGGKHHLFKGVVHYITTAST